MHIDGAQPSPENPYISVFAVKITPFWRKNGNIWFMHVESRFVAADISRETTEFHYVFESLDSMIFKEISRILSKPLGDKPYYDLEERIVTSKHNNSRSTKSQ